ncbi:MAG: ATP-binding cassette domain-containing protein [Desulfofustis sp.]
MLTATNISKSFDSDGSSSQVLRDVSVELNEGEFTAIVGRSGSGKTTLLNVLSTLVRPDKGELRYYDDDLASLSETRLNSLRKSDFSMIFQFHHLLPYLTVLENTLLPFMSSVQPVKADVESRARDCLARVGLADKAHRLPGKLRRRTAACGNSSGAGKIIKNIVCR